MQTRLEILGDEMISPASIEEKKKLIEKLEQDGQKDTDTEQKLTEQLDYMENYWEELEDDYERREKGIEWMKSLPAGRRCRWIPTLKITAIPPATTMGIPCAMAASGSGM